MKQQPPTKLGAGPSNHLQTPKEKTGEIDQIFLTKKWWETSYIDY
jgi:hypothetical protein